MHLRDFRILWDSCRVADKNAFVQFPGAEDVRDACMLIQIPGMNKPQSNRRALHCGSYGY